VATIPSNRGSNIPPMPPTVDLRKKCERDGIAGLAFGFHISLHFLWGFHTLFILAMILMYSFGFAKLALTVSVHFFVS